MPAPRAGLTARRKKDSRGVTRTYWVKAQEVTQTTRHRSLTRLATVRGGVAGSVAPGAHAAPRMAEIKEPSSLGGAPRSVTRVWKMHAEGGEIKMTPEPLAPPATPPAPVKVTTPSDGFYKAGVTVVDDRGKSIGAADVNRHMRDVFKRPDGKPASYEDIKAMFADPGGPFTITPRTIARNPDGTHAVDAYGNPKLVQGATVTVPRVKVNFEEISVDERMYSTGRATVLKFKMTVRNADTDEVISDDFDREFTHHEESGKTEVYHDSLGFKDKYQGGGIGTALFKNMVENYPKLGVSKIGVSAAMVGKYTWARMGFEWLPANHETGAQDFGTYASKFRKPNGERYTAMEAANVFRNAKTARDAAAITMPVLGPDGVKMVPMVKNMMLTGRSSGWSGKVKIEDGDPNYEHMKQYLGITPKPAPLPPPPPTPEPPLPAKRGGRPSTLKRKL